MKKEALIKLLQNIPGNPEIVIWNGYVQDYQHIHPKFPKLELFKIKLSKLRELLRYEIFRDQNFKGNFEDIKISEEELQTAYKNYSFETPNEFFTEEECKDFYGRKKIYYCLEMKERGKSTFDRCSTLNY